MGYSFPVFQLGGGGIDYLANVGNFIWCRILNPASSVETGPE
jgi:hypothetical protein